jgi:aspartyl-tRNA(Asn)/glutamyl-tRNA(Gln) amidotransferase subunit C
MWLLSGFVPFGFEPPIGSRERGEASLGRHDRAVAVQKLRLLYKRAEIPRSRLYIMSVDAATVRRIAHLARIAVTDAEVPHLAGELNAMLAFVEQLSEVDVDGVEPMTSVMPMAMKKRADVVDDGEIPDDIVRNAPATENHFFLVPKVVE